MLTLTLGLLALFQAQSRPADVKPKPVAESRPKAGITLPSSPVPSDRDVRAASRPAESRPNNIFHARVQVVLKNQQKLNGIVKSNKFYEAESGMGFRTTTKEDRNAGLRLWFAHKGHNWLFLRYNEIQSVNTIGRVSDIEVREMEAKLDAELDARLLQENSERIAEVAAQVKALNDARQKEEADAEAKKKAEAEQKKKDALDKATKLMDRFPESQGWGEEKKTEILTKKNNHLYPTAEEIEFLQLFPEWLKARKLLDNERKRAEGEPVEDEPEDPDDKTDGGGL